MSIYKKIRESKKKASAAKLNVFAATAKGVAAGQEAIESAEESAAKYKNPITYKSSALRKNGDPTDPRYKGIKNYKGNAVEYYLDEVQNQGGSITIPGKKDDYDGSGGYMSNEDWTKFLQTEQGKAYTEKYSDKTVDLPGETTRTGTIKPLTETITKPDTQQYNMGFDQAEDANWARGAMRRGLNRDERKAVKNRVKGMSNADRKEFRKKMREQRKGSFLGLGLGGSRQERKIQALKDMGALDKDYKSARQRIGDATLDMNSEESKSKIESATMNKYNMPIDSYGDFKKGSTKTQNVSGEGYDTITDDDIGTKTFKNYFAPKGEGSFNFGGVKDYAAEFKANTDKIINNSGSGLFKKAKQYKGKFGRGAGYKK